MKKLMFLSILFTLISMCVTAQLKGFNFKDAIPQDQITDDTYEEPIKMPDGSYVMIFKENPIGYKHCINKGYELASLNNCDDPIYENITLPGWAEGIHDYHNVDLALQSGNAEIIIRWKTDSEIYFTIACSEKVYGLIVAPLN